MLSLESSSGRDDTPMRRPSVTVMEYVRDLREAMGEEWVNANPQAFALLVQAAAIDMHGSTIGKEPRKLTGAVVSAASRL